MGQCSGPGKRKFLRSSTSLSLSLSSVGAAGLDRDMPHTQYIILRLVVGQGHFDLVLPTCASQRGEEREREGERERERSEDPSSSF